MRTEASVLDPRAAAGSRSGGSALSAGAGATVGRLIRTNLAVTTDNASPRNGRRAVGWPRRREGDRVSNRGRDILMGVPLFSDLSKRHVRRIADLMEEQRFHEG